MTNKKMSLLEEVTIHEQAVRNPEEGFSPNAVVSVVKALREDKGPGMSLEEALADLGLGEHK